MVEIGDPKFGVTRPSCLRSEFLHPLVPFPTFVPHNFVQKRKSAGTSRPTKPNKSKVVKSPITSACEYYLIEEKNCTKLYKIVRNPKQHPPNNAEWGSLSQKSIVELSDWEFGVGADIRIKLSDRQPDGFARVREIRDLGDHARFVMLVQWYWSFKEMQAHRRVIHQWPPMKWILGTTLDVLMWDTANGLMSEKEKAEIAEDKVLSQETSIPKLLDSHDERLHWIGLQDAGSVHHGKGQEDEDNEDIGKDEDVEESKDTDADADGDGDGDGDEIEKKNKTDAGDKDDDLDKECDCNHSDRGSNKVTASTMGMKSGAAFRPRLTRQRPRLLRTSRAAMENTIGTMPRHPHSPLSETQTNMKQTVALLRTMNFEQA